ncbi:hypothetical protein [Caulobacter sp. BP25]|uniref:hypothetical protein n=1 Tax=Caulobacter sp. BP25 TaxID=2048900 RepID=UPI000C12D88F|nr:hypothetical protein [Caulobacter sp. BP25]PHY17254.1 hypothetical protein CSW59_19710 [Caulobacter sp. BP25]
MKAGLGLGLGAGIAIGVGLGLALDSLALGLGVGVAMGGGIGLSMGAAMQAKSAKPTSKDGGVAGVDTTSATSSGDCSSDGGGCD